MLLLQGMLHASQPRLTTITLPLWYLGSAASEEPIVISEVPKIYSGTDADAWVALFSSPVYPDGGKTDINLISIYKINVSAVAGKDDEISRFSVDTSKAVKPDGYPFEIDVIASQVARCIRRECLNATTRIFILHAGDERLFEPTEARRG